MDRRLYALYGGFALCLASLVSCGFPRPADVPDCTRSSDCTSPGVPFCDTSSGTCVGCLDGTSCPTDRPVCDPSSQTCRACDRDDECPSGVCLAADGQCADEAELVYVSGSSTVDTGECTAEAPCASLPYALSKVTATRNVIVIRGGLLRPVDTIVVSRSVYIDGAGVTIGGNGVIFAIAPFIAVTIADMSLAVDAPNGFDAAMVGASSSLRMYRADVRGSVTTNGGTIAAIKSTFSSAIICADGTVATDASRFKNAPVSGMNCQILVKNSRFDMLSDGSISVQGGFSKIENNVIVNAYELADSMSVTAVAPGSFVRFNTFVNTSGVASDGVALYCDGTSLVTSNIFAYGSKHPANGVPRCEARYSLYDAIALSEQTVGVGNKVGDSSTFFVDKVGKDFHLSTASPAKGAGEPGLDVSRDIDGAPRPFPAASQPDMGAYEAP